MYQICQLKCSIQKKLIWVYGVAKELSKDISNHENIFKLVGRKFDFVSIIVLIKNRFLFNRRPKYWFPNLKKVVLYSEILDKHFSIICTARTLSLIDQHCGLDSYILRTEVQDFKSQLALSLRREMLLTLVRKQFKDANHERDMLEKYSDVIIPVCYIIKSN